MFLEGTNEISQYKEAERQKVIDRMNSGVPVPQRTRHGPTSR